MSSRGIALGQQSPGAENVRLPLRQPRGLLVEDEFTHLRRRKTVLATKDLNVVAAASQGEALTRLRSLGFRVDVVLTDLNLSGTRGSTEGVEVARAVDDHWGGTVPVFGYSGKSFQLPQDQKALFAGLVLKTAFAIRIRGLFEDAAKAGHRHFDEAADRAEAMLGPLQAKRRKLEVSEVTFIRDLIAGSIPSPVPVSRIPESVGFLRLSDTGVGIPYGVEERRTPRGKRVYVAPIGHHYLEVCAAEADDAVSILEEMLLGFIELVRDSNDDAVGASRRLRALVRALIRRDLELQGSS